MILWSKAEAEVYVIIISIKEEKKTISRIIAIIIIYVYFKILGLKHCEKPMSTKRLRESIREDGNSI